MFLITAMIVFIFEHVQWRWNSVTAPPTARLLSTGVEDYFDSSYHWSHMLAGGRYPIYHGEDSLGTLKSFR
jgi:hypothetical protein